MTCDGVPFCCTGVVPRWVIGFVPEVHALGAGARLERELVPEQPVDLESAPAREQCAHASGA